MGEPFATSFAANLASKLAKYLIAPIGRQLGYVLFYKSYIEALENGVKGLEIEWERVQHSVREAENDGKPIETNIKNWLESVKEETEKACDLLKRGESAKDACFRGWLPNPVVRHPIGRKVKKITKIIQELRDESKNSFFLKVYYENTPRGIVKATPFTARYVHVKEDVLASRASLTEDVLNAIADDKVGVIGVYGPGGVGKSKLMEDVERQVREEKLFDVVATTNVSRDLDLKRIQGEIAYALGLNLMNEETTLGRADRLCNRLKQDSEKKILIILDNLWTKLELKEVGIPCGDNNKARGCKLLLTSRYRNILYAGMACDREFQLNELEHGEARILFERTVGDKVNDPQLKNLVDGVVMNCGGLPLLIISVATRLKRGGLAEWRNASTNIEGSNVKSIVELSYNDLKDERIKSLFLVCALYFGRPHMRDILVSSMALGLYNTISQTIERARDGLITDLHRLIDFSLLLGSNDLGLLSMDDLQQLSMHDLFIDVAISMHDKFIDIEWNSLVGRKDFGFKGWSKYDLRKCTAMAFHYVGIDELPNKLDCPNMRILLLLEHNRFLKMPESFFEFMEKLQVLDITGLSFTSLPSSMELLGNLKSLYLDGCHLEDVTILGKLKGLQFLSFIDSTIARLPKEIGWLTELRFLDLRRCIGLKVIEPGILGSLVNLEELYMQDSFDGWEAEDEAPRSNASLTEFKHMKKLSTLHITIPHASTLPTGLQFGKLNRYCIQIGCRDRWSGYKESRTLELKLDSDNLLVENWIQRCLEITEDLHLEILQGGNDSIRDLCFEGFQDLKHLHVKNSSSFQYVVPPTNNARRPAFTKLESLFVENMNNLKKICCICLAPESFSKLKIMRVDKCDEIMHLFPLSMMEILSQLEELEIRSCRSMQQVIRDVEADEIVDDPTVKSCNLHRLTLRNLPMMTSFSKIVNNSVVFFDRPQVSFPQLESLTLAELPKLEEIWNSQYPSEVSNLKFLVVEDCTSLLSIIPSNLLIKLQSLEAITVKKCRLIREVFDLEELTPSEDVEILGQLMRLTLNGLPRLERIWNKNPRGVLCFQNLWALKVQNCENLRFLFSSSMAKALVQIKEIEIASCVLMEEIMDMQEEESEEVATTDTLEFPLLTSLSLLKLPNLKTFSYGKYYIHCPSLTKLTISSCPKMTTFASFEGRQQSTTSGMGSQQAFHHINSGLSLPIFLNEKVFFPNLEELKISSMCQLKRIWHDQLHNQSLCKLASLSVEYCENLSNVFPSNSLDRLQCLNKIEVIGCTSLEALFEPISLSSEKRQKPLVLNALNKMKLLNLPRLINILKSDCQVTLAFPSLMEVNVRHCHSLTYLFSSATAKNLDQLAELDVSCCNNLRGIVAVEEGKGTTIETLNFQQLGKLKLGDLENLISFRSTSGANDLQPLFDEKLAFPKLEELHIKGAQQEDLWNDNILPESFRCLKILKVEQCHNLMNVIPSFMWKRLFYYLESLTVEKCPRLRNLVTISMAKNLGQLQHLSLNGCREMEYIVAKEEEKPEEAAEKIVMSHLVTLYLHNMPKLKSFYQRNYISEWPSLKEFTIENCEAVEAILGDASCRKLEGSILIQQPLLLVKKIKEIEVARCVLMEEITDMQEEESEEVPTTNTVEFPLLNSLSLLEMPNLKTFYHGKYYIHCPSLTRLTISSCPKMMTFPSFEGRQQLTTSGMGVQQAFDRFNSGLSLPSFFNAKVFFSNLKELKLSYMCQLKRIWHDQLNGQSFCKLASVTAEFCENLSYVFPSNSMERLQSLNKIEVVGCPSLEALFEPVTFSSEKRQKPLVLNALNEMKLLNLPRLTNIWKSDCRVTLAFPGLMEAKVRRCHSLPYLFSSATAKTLHKLAKLDVSHCNNLRGIIALEEGKGTSVETLRFQQLGKLKLRDLENLISFCSANCANDGLRPLFDDKLAFPKLEELYIEGAKQEDLWNDKILSGSFCCLKILKVKQCHNLINVIPSFMWKRIPCLESLTIQKCPRLRNLVTISLAKNLGQLQQLSLSGCGEMEYIIAREEEKPEEAANKIVISHLVTLYLHNMPKLKSFFQGNHISKWPYLKEFTIENCKAVEVILEDANCRKLEGSIPIQRPLLLVKKVNFPNMEMMKISHMDNVEKIWLDDLASNAFSKLKTLVVEYCEKFSSIFSSHTILTRFQNLEELTVTDCESLEVVFHSQESDSNEARSVSAFQLKGLVLKRLPRMKHVWSGLGQGGLLFGRLRKIEVVECGHLKSLFPNLMAKSMTQLEELEVQSCKGVEEIIAKEDRVGLSASDLFFPQLTHLTLLELPTLKYFFMNSHTSRWPLLEHLHVRHCCKMSLFSFFCEIQSYQDTTVSRDQPALFPFEKVMPRLTESTLTREDVVMTPQHYTFPNLTDLTLSCYHDENVDFPSDFLLHRFPNLVILAVECSSFEEIFPEDASGHGGATPYGGLADVDKPLQALGNLGSLSLRRLGNLRRVWKDGSLMAEILNQIRFLQLEECPSLSILFPSSTSFQRLTYLEVEDCVGLVHVMTCSAATSLVHLRSLTLRNCGAMEDVVTDDRNGAEEISFPSLWSLTLDGLPSLESFSPANCAFRFPSLWSITVKQCPKLNIFCKGALRTPELHGIQLYSDNDYVKRWEGDLNTTIRTLST